MVRFWPRPYFTCQNLISGGSEVLPNGQTRETDVKHSSKVHQPLMKTLKEPETPTKVHEFTDDDLNPIKTLYLAGFCLWFCR